MEKLLANKPAFIKATPPASTMLADQDEERRNLERMSDDLEQASSQAWLDACAISNRRSCYLPSCVFTTLRIATAKSRSSGVLSNGLALFVML